LDPLQSALLGGGIAHDTDEDPGVSKVIVRLDLGDAYHAIEPGIFDLARKQLADLLAQQFIYPVDASGHGGLLGSPGRLSWELACQGKGTEGGFF
jgi:hypothetical protein